MAFGLRGIVHIPSSVFESLEARNREAEVIGTNRERRIDHRMAPGTGIVDQGARPRQAMPASDVIASAHWLFRVDQAIGFDTPIRYARTDSCAADHRRQDLWRHRGGQHRNQRRF